MTTIRKLRLSKTRISLHAHEFSIIRMSLIWAYQRAPPDQRVTSEDSDLACKTCEKYIQGLKMMDEIAEVST